MFSRAVVFDSAGPYLKHKEIEIPDLKEGEILVRNEFVTLCRSDINTFTGKRKEKNPTILGHEIVGRIADFGKNTLRKDLRGLGLSEGDRITWGIYSSEPDSYYSVIGIPQKGENLFKYGHEELTPENTLHGGLAQYIILRKNTPVVKISDKIPKEIAATINCSIATVSGAFRIAGDVKDKKVLITGAGMLGTVSCAIAKSVKAGLIAVSDIDTSRIKTALEFGADFALIQDELRNSGAGGFGRKFDIIMDFSGVPESMESSLENLDIGGTAVWVGATFPQRNLSINAETIVRKIHTIRGLHNYNQEDLINAVKFLEENIDRYPFGKLIHSKFTLEQIADAFEYALSINPFRVGIEIK